MAKISGFILFVIAFILIIILTPIGMIFTTIKCIFEYDLTSINRYYKDIAISLDQLGNVVMAGLMNIVLIKGEEHLFGNPDETISSVIGKNKVDNTLTLSGKILDWILNKIDTNHSIDAIED